MVATILHGFFLVGLVVAIVIRSRYGRHYRRTYTAAETRREGGFVWGLMALWGVSQILPLIAIFTPWLDGANYWLPPAAGLAGIPIFAVGVWLLWRSHADLSNNWSPTLELHEDHTLVTEGVYRLVRHPMYTAHWLWSLAQILLIQNWVAGWLPMIVFLPLYRLRVPREERMMLEHFGEAYRSYMNRTGRIFPSF
jgi:protein-S-isoprenylcysteine O-methyltransferase Ste14